jgi:steroid 5-alpha reductase family enzyme
MPDFHLAYAALLGLAASLTLAVATWLVSLARHDVSIVDRVWSLLILSAAVVYAAALSAAGPRAAWLLGMLAVWAARLAVYITWRNWGEGEDRRYREIRKRNEPGFATKSLYLVFGLQAVLAWIVSWPLLAALASPQPPGWLDVLGVAVFALGLACESIADAQLARFRSRRENAGRVLDTGLWRYTRHPNYFGEFCVWWGLYLVALAAGGWWSVVSPLLMSVLLLRVSGVTLLEKGIGERRPGYRDYIASTNAFFPGLPRVSAAQRRARP